MRIRAFLAVNLGVPLVQRIADEVARAKAQLPPDAKVAWVAPANYHVTLAFLGAIDEELVEGIAGRIVPIARAIAPFELRARGFGRFPSPPQSPRVLWVGVEGTTPEAQGNLVALQRNVVTALGGLGVALPEEDRQRPYSAHLTVGRVRHGGVPWDSAQDFGTSLVREVVLYESASAAGPSAGQGIEYRARARLPLGPGK